MSERIELTRGAPAPNTERFFEYTGPDPDAALETLFSDGFAFGPVKLWTDAPDLALAFARLLEEKHPGGCEDVLWWLVPVRRSAYDEAGHVPPVLEHPTVEEVEAWAAALLK